MTDRTRRTQLGVAGSVAAATATVMFAVATRQDGELVIVLWVAGTLLLTGGVVLVGAGYLG